MLNTANGGGAQHTAMPCIHRLLSETVLEAVKPSAVLLTGDLVDGRNKNGGGRQSRKEWQVPPPPQAYATAEFPDAIDSASKKCLIREQNVQSYVHNCFSATAVSIPFLTRLSN